MVQQPKQHAVPGPQRFTAKPVPERIGEPETRRERGRVVLKQPAARGGRTK